MANSKKTIITLLVVGVVGYLVYERVMPGGGFQQQMGVMPVSVAKVVERDIQEWYEFSGRLTAVDQVEIRPQVSGIMQEVHFADGAMVHKGDVLFTIDQRPFIAALEAARASYAYASSEYNRATSLLKDKAIPKGEADQRYNAYQQAKSALTKAELDIDYSVIKSSIDGRVSRAEVTEGNLVQSGPNAPVLTTVVSMSPIYADFDIDEETFMKYAHDGATANNDTAKIPVTIALAGESQPTHKGRIESFDNRLNNASGTLRVRALIDNADNLLVPGLFARVRMGAANPSHALLITDRAVGTDQNKKFVLVVGEDGKTEHREVKLGSLVDGLRVVREGLKPGEQIIVSGLQRVMMPGQPVKPEEVPMDTPETALPSAGGAKPGEALAAEGKAAPEGQDKQANDKTN